MPDMNDQILNQIADDGADPGPLAPQEAERLRKLLAEAYPQPKGNLSAAVLAAIRAEGTAGGSKVLPAADSRKRGRAAILGRVAKWGSLAACVALAAAIGFYVLPRYDAKNLTAANTAKWAADTAADSSEMAYAGANDADEAETPADQAAEERIVAEAAPEYEEAAIAEEPAAADYGLGGMLTMVPGSAAPGMADGLNGLVGLPENAFDEAAVPAPAYPGDKRGESAIGGIWVAAASAPYVPRTDCAHAGALLNAYHDIPEVLIAAVGADAFNEWAAEAQEEDPCGVNILSFAVAFSLTAEDIYAVGDTWYYLDLPDIPLTEENAEAVAAYYANGGDPGKMLPRLFSYRYRTALIREVTLSRWLAWRAGDTAMRTWTVGELAQQFGLTSARLGEIWTAEREAFLAEYPGAEVPEVGEIA